MIPQRFDKQKICYTTTLYEQALRKDEKKGRERLTLSVFFVDCAPPHLLKGGREKQEAKSAHVADGFASFLVNDLFTLHGLDNTESVLANHSREMMICMVIKLADETVLEGLI
jgi:hypothetical protein